MDLPDWTGLDLGLGRLQGGPGSAPGRVWLMYSIQHDLNIWSIEVDGKSMEVGDRSVNVRDTICLNSVNCCPL